MGRGVDATEYFFLVISRAFRRGTKVRVFRGRPSGAREGGGVDLMVAMNPQTWDEDVRSIVPGGYLFYDNTKPMPASKFREDIIVLGVPLTEMTNGRLQRSAAASVVQEHRRSGFAGHAAGYGCGPRLRPCWPSNSKAATS